MNFDSSNMASSSSNVNGTAFEVHEMAYKRACREINTRINGYTYGQLSAVDPLTMSHTLELFSAAEFSVCGMERKASAEKGVNRKSAMLLALQYRHDLEDLMKIYQEIKSQNRPIKGRPGSVSNVDRGLESVQVRIIVSPESNPKAGVNIVCGC